jgi:L-threonylcarbamoyladenylate synthase
VHCNPLQREQAQAHSKHGAGPDGNASRVLDDFHRVEGRIEPLEGAWPGVPLEDFARTGGHGTPREVNLRPGHPESSLRGGANAERPEFVRHPRSVLTSAPRRRIHSLVTPCQPPTEEALHRAVDVLRRGGLVGLPTETVYGLAADAENELAVRRIFAVKGRPSTHPLIVHLASAEAAKGWVSRLPPEAELLAASFWPGPLTLVLPRSTRASDAVTGGQGTVAVRVPAHPVARAVLRAFGGGLAAPSANRFGRVSPTRAAHVLADLGGEVDFILDGGPCSVGVESTIIDLSGPKPVLLRPGGVALEAVEGVLGRAISQTVAGEVRAPGMLPSHYAPRAGLVLAHRSEAPRLAEELQRSGRRVALCSPEATVPAGVVHLRAPEDVAELARSLYGLLRDVDKAGVDVAVVVVPEEAGLGLAVLDRLRRAAAPRDPVL